MTKLNKKVAALAKADAAKKPPPSEDALKKLKEKISRARDIDFELLNLAERGKALSEEKTKLLRTELPDAYEELGVRSLGIEKDGNLPAYNTELKPFYHANIPEENEEAAFAWLEKNKHGDMIKTTITVTLGRGDRARAKQVEAALKKLKVPYERKLGVPWNTLTAFVKEQVEKYQKTPPLSLLGATVGRIVQLKPVKEEK